ncbi:hypothetical protein TNIN_424711 [Trichonephila inaurata madagascariensis]|uniref:Uncharacterized protein n=1 Tax=Trichonephila inaurata madagascariensis TaxID=2747483 RepID=A0A8X6M6S1_9ARAC|nr:hypothetical protein TNIN_424711 [Trichonephila inaurata madagascariensis]
MILTLFIPLGFPLESFTQRIPNLTQGSDNSSVHLQSHLPTLPSSNFAQAVSTKRRKYDTSYLWFGFSRTGDEEAPECGSFVLQTAP